MQCLIPVRWNWTSNNSHNNRPLLSANNQMQKCSRGNGVVLVYKVPSPAYRGML